MAEHMTWESPPIPEHGYDWVEVAQLLRAHPGQWLRVFEDGPISIVNAIRQSTITAMRPIRKRTDTHQGFEVMTRNNKPGPPRTCALYVRWVAARGDNDGAATSSD